MTQGKKLLLIATFKQLINSAKIESRNCEKYLAVGYLIGKEKEIIRKCIC